ncbi:MFS transporter [Paeniglutamicibacter cryotolerans]|uniref:MFS family permease n=1 Tax=Paeniglutamicibacter cryotolerans TaxID=670079 RepID=A0A839QGC0_9MICC|nr:MFS transporter [Paeniglutamicibacter cryotolerans]MBB2995209.1 MFS family permease [Paeniglutamicibacter cryotolerans]
MTGEIHPPTKLWTGNFILASVANLFISMVFYLLITSMALYAVERFRASDSTAGLASSMFIIGSVAARLFAGKLMDSLGRKRLLVFALAFFVLGSVLYIPTGSLGLLLLLRFVHGMAFGAGNTALSTAIQALIPPSRRSEGTGYFGLSTTLSTAAGPYLAVLFASSGNFTAVFLFCTASSAIALAIAVFLKLPEAAPRTAGGHPAKRSRSRFSLGSLIDHTALPISLVILVTGVAYSGIVSFLAPFMVQESMAEAASWFFLVYAFTVLVSRLFAGRIQDKYGDNAVMYPLLMVFALGMAALALEPSSLSIMGAGAFAGLGFGALMPCAQAIAISVVPPARMGVATSTYFLMLDVGIGLGPVVLGLFIPYLGYTGMFAGLSGLTVLAIGVYYLAHGRLNRRPGPSTATA